MSPVVLLLLAASIVNGQLNGQPRIILSDEPWQVQNSQSLQRIQWTAGKATGKVYCVSEAPVMSMRFICPDCNSTEIDTNLGKYAQDRSAQAGYPTLQLNNMPVTKELNGKTLVCEGIFGPNANLQNQPFQPNVQNNNNNDNYNDNQQPTQPQSNVVSAQATIVVQYLDTPQIRDSQGGLPLVSENGGGQFFYISSTGTSLTCVADGNPSPRAFKWRKDGAEVAGATGPSLAVSTADVRSSVQCSADNQILNMPLDSPAVALELFVEPEVVMKNFKDAQVNTPFEGGNRIQLKRNVGLDCYATGNPKPMIMWYQQIGSSGLIVNASCTQSMDGLVEPIKTWPPNTPIIVSTGQQVTGKEPSFADRWTIQSQCTVQVDNYGAAGRVWCSACSMKTAGQYTCAPPQNAPPSDAVVFDVYGRPEMSANDSDSTYPNAQEVPDNSALITSQYCADPQPNPSDRYWLIDGNRLNMGDRSNNFVSDTPRPDTLYPDCFTARLRIEGYSAEDTRRNIQLVVKNRYGQLDGQTVNLDSLLGGNILTGGTDVGLAVGLAIGLFVLLVLLILAFLWWRRLLCFSGKKGGRREAYPANVAPEHVRSADPVVKSPLGNNGYGQEFIPESRQQEGINYAELDLVNSSSRPPSILNNTEYTQLQQPPPPYSSATRSVTDSVV